MIVTLIRIDAQEASGGAVPVFLASHDRPEACHLGGDQWDPALAELPSFALDFFGGAFAGQVTAPRTSFAVATLGLSAFGTTPATRARFADARVRIWIGDITSAATVDLGPLTLRFDGRIAAEPEVDEAARIARFEAVVQDSWADKPLLALFAGTGGIEGPAELTGQPKPLVLGNARFCGGVLIDTGDNVWMVSNGPVQAINAVYDRLASLGTSAGNFADLAALKAASIPNGSWGTCLAQGLVRLGAPPDGRVSFDVSGSNSGTGGYVRRPGAIMRRIADLAGGTVNAASLTALDTARPYNLQLQLREQVTAREIIGQIADSVAAVAGVSLRGELFAQALAIGGSGEALNADDSSALRVAAVEELTKAAPFWRLATEAELTFELHSAEEAAFSYRWQGEYSAARVYRLDDVVTGPDGAAWAYINATPASGQALPVWPVTSNSHWRLFQAPAGASIAPANANRVPLSRMEGNSGWVRGSSSPGSGSVVYSTVGGRRVATVLAVATAAEQFVQVSSAETGTQMSFPVRGGERLSISARVAASGSLSRWQINFGYRRADGAYLEAAVGSGLGSRALDDPRFATFFTVPADAVVGAFLLFGVSSGAGSYEVAVSEPMVTSAAPGQTVHPDFSPGPVLTGPVDAGGPLLVGTLPPGRAEGDFGGNFIADPIFGEGWVYSNAAYSPGLSGGNLYDRHRAVFLGEGVIWFVGSGFPALERAAVTVGETYYFSGWFFRAASATGHVAARVELYDATGANIGVQDIPGVTTIGMATNAWTRMQGQWTCPAGVAYVRPLVGNNTGGNTSTIFVGLPYFGRHQPGADVTADAQITFTTPPPFQIQADSAGITTTDLSTQTRSITLLRGGVAQTSGVTVGTPTANPSAAISVASATVSGGIVTVTLATANASGSVTIPVIFESVSYPVTIPVNRTIAPPPSGGSASELFNDGSWANINTTTYTQVTDSGATVRSTSGGQLSFGFSAQYNGGNVQCKAQYSLNGTTWSDVAGTETTGSGPITVPGEEEPGSISRAPVTQSSLAASTLYFVRLVARRTGGTGTISWIAPSFTARQP